MISGQQFNEGERAQYREQIRQRLLRDGTPIEDHRDEFGLWVKREDLSARKPGPPFSKTRGVFAHIVGLDERVDTIGVLDTYHSQAGHAVAHACRQLGLDVVNFYPEYKREPGYREPQERAKALGAELVGLPAGRSAVIYHQARAHMKRYHGDRGYLMPNALKLPEMVAETAREVATLPDGFEPERVIIPISSGTIAAGVIQGFLDRDTEQLPDFILHIGYERSPEAVLRYVSEKCGPGYPDLKVTLINERYGYKDKARPGETPPWPCSPYYDLKALRWWMRTRDTFEGDTLLWNVG